MLQAVAPDAPAGQVYDRSRMLLRSAAARQDSVYELAILGSGAGAAYCIANSTLSLDKTLLVGEKQPWEGQRGADGRVNHPHPQIDPEDQARFDPRSGLAERAEFSARIKAVVDRVPHQCDGRITGVEKNRTREGGPVYWKISTTRGTFFAQRVLSGLGAGEHVSRGNAGVDMDTYKRSIETVSAAQRDLPFSIAISGGSAAIDVVTDVLRKFSVADIHWAPGNGGAQFISGTDNDISAIPYFEGLKVVRDDLALQIAADPHASATTTRRAEQQKIDDEIARLQPDIDAAKALLKNWADLAKRVRIYPGRGVIKANTGPDSAARPYQLEAGGRVIQVEKAVYAVGQDNEAVSRLFQDNTGGGANRLEVAPTIDLNQHFTVAPSETDREALRGRLGRPDLGLVPWGPGGAQVDLLADPDLGGGALEAFGTPAVPLGAESVDGSLKFVGAQGFRELEAQATLAGESARQDAAAAAGAARADRPEAERRAARSRAAADAATRAVDDMNRGVPGSLGRNVVNNAQLTSARERIAAGADALPFDSDDLLLVAEADGVSFITANQTVLATHIAVMYPSIAPGLADYLVAQIIVGRAGPTGPIPQRRASTAPGEPEHHLRAFQQFHDMWRDRLRYFEAQMQPSRRASWRLAPGDMEQGG